MKPSSRGGCTFGAVVATSLLLYQFSFGGTTISRGSSSFSPTAQYAYYYNKSKEVHDVLNNTSASKNCSEEDLNKNRRVLCSTEQIRNGKWVPRTMEKVPYTSSYEARFCGGQSAYERQQDVNASFESHEWLPQDHKTCEFSRWSREEFCRVMHNESLLMMGDSLGKEHHVSLGGLTGLGDFQEQFADRLMCNGTVQIVFRRDDILKGPLVKWQIDHTFPSYALLNRGAHYVPDKVHLKDMKEIIGHVQRWQARCKEEGKACQLIWKTTVPGHPNCKNYHEPDNNLTLMETSVATNAVSRQYNWHLFKHQNELMIDALKAAGVDFSVLDAYTLKLLRPDGHVNHRDCLHSCMGSKVDVLSQVMMHLIKLHRIKLHRAKKEEQRESVPKCTDSIRRA
jgi:hypothetical protein